MRDIIKWFHAHFILGVLVEKVDCREAHTLACNVIDSDLRAFFHIPRLGTLPPSFHLDKTPLELA